jgi:uncharacterized protein
MTVEVRPLGDKCNIQCRYCYQEGIRAAGNVSAGYDLTAMLNTLDALSEPFSLFGGEIMMTRRRDLEQLLAFGLQRYGGSNLQTNGTLIDEADLRLFSAYAVRLGVSIDGPGALNDARWAGTLAATRRATARTEAVIETLCREATPPSIIITLHRMNAAGARLDILIDWLRFLDGLGVRRVRLHTLEIDSEAAAADLQLSRDDSVAVMRRLRALGPELASIRFDIFDEMTAMLRGQDHLASCQFHACDSYATQAVVGVEGDGTMSNCGRTNKDGVGYLRAGSHSFERQITLHRTPQQDGGCADCRFFLMCKGNCPGTAMDGDWRLRSADCPVWFALFADIERDLCAAGEVPLSLSPQRAAIEARMVEAWSQGENPALSIVCNEVAGL